MVRLVVGLAIDAAAVGVRPAFGAGLRDRAVDDDDDGDAGELDALAGPGEFGEPVSAEATAVATAEPAPASAPVIATPRHTCLIVVTSSSPICFQLLHSCLTD
ncbi:hypothetical protein [Mycobacterium sp. RTGN5]|uniref:hypothetical protein n=1 Tax=Mycobacterium sp. RTGN5 TaxID=3016522 RepID=UPI0029C612B4|nr:hypothetical protein [Mycobacterium sp. RTGN5]